MVGRPELFSEPPDFSAVPCDFHMLRHGHIVRLHAELRQYCRGVHDLVARFVVPDPLPPDIDIHEGAYLAHYVAPDLPLPVLLCGREVEQDDQEYDIDRIDEIGMQASRYDGVSLAAFRTYETVDVKDPCLLVQTDCITSPPSMTMQPDFRMRMPAFSLMLAAPAVLHVVPHETLCMG